MGDTDGWGGLVNMLAACAAASVGIDSEVFLIDFDIQVFFNIGHDIQGYKGSLAFALCVEWGDPHQAVHSFFWFQIAVCVFSVYLEGNGFNAGFVAVQEIQDFHSKAFSFRPSGIHSVEHAAPVAAFCTACACVKLQYGAVLIILAGKKRADAQRFQFFREGIQLRTDFLRHRLVVFLISHFNERLDIVILGEQILNLLHGILQVLKFFHFLIGIFRIIPKSRSLHLALQFFDSLRLFS